MSKSTNFSGQPVFNQLLAFLDKTEIKAIGKQHNAERYVKKFNTYNHVVVMLFVAFESYLIENIEGEVYFFRQMKPPFYGKLIYYISIYNFQIKKPAP